MAHKKGMLCGVAVAEMKVGGPLHHPPFTQRRHIYILGVKKKVG